MEAREVMQIGEWVVSAVEDDDGHLTLSVSREDESSIVEMEQDLGSELEWMSRFTSESIESEYLSD